MFCRYLMVKRNIIKKKGEIMKQICYIILFFTAFFYACEKDVDSYEGESGIYFDTEGKLNDTVVVSWGMTVSYTHLTLPTIA